MNFQSTDYELEITECNNSFSYYLKNKVTNELVLFGSDVSEDNIIENLSEINTALRSIFG